jgi:hypothetical protein
MGRYGVDGEREGLGYWFAEVVDGEREGVGYWFAEVVDLLTRGLSKV